MDADPIGNCALRYREERSADNGHDHDSGTVTGKRAKFCYTKRENAREHDGIKEADGDDGPHGRMARGQHRNGDEGSGTDRANAKQSPGADLLQKSGTKKTPDHGAAPVEGDETGRNLFRQSANLRLAEVV